MVAPLRPKTAQEWWAEISGPGYLEGLLLDAPRDFCALECLANAPLYAKPDSQKVFLLWKARKSPEVHIHAIPYLCERHPWLYSLFIDEAHGTVRFPLNTWDTDPDMSISPRSIIHNLYVYGASEPILFRWSTASRSCLALIPDSIERLLKSTNFRDEEWKKLTELSRQKIPGVEQTGINIPEWNEREKYRFYDVVRDVGAMARYGVEASGGRGSFRLYSIKTGVNFVGSKDETYGGKDLLEANCHLAMFRSEAIEACPPRDTSFGVQTEVLTVTAPTIRYENDKQLRDGFQVRDLSCMEPGLDYIPCQAIPYARKAFDRDTKLGELSPAEQCAFWRTNFAVPLGRAKARLFLNYGLMHTSANAQNFILGFSGSTLKLFVVRDIGDTSWHDDYITRYLQNSGASKAYTVFRKERDAATEAALEQREAFYHLLAKTSSTQYPPPYILRLAANAVLTHDFAAALKKKQSWMDVHVYRFATGILDGFKDFMLEALTPALPAGPSEHFLRSDDIRRYGVDGKYPYPFANQAKYLQVLGDIDSLDTVTLFTRAAQVRERGTDAMYMAEDHDFYRKGDDDCICTLINAEELLLCAAFDKILTTGDLNAPLVNCLIGKRLWPPVVPQAAARVGPPVEPPESKEQVHK